MHLVEALAAGVRGAENGTVELYRRGTSTRATWYASFEADGVNATNADIPLDSFGGAIVYVAELCDVVVKNSLGTPVREFTAGVREDVVEVQSPSFTGVDYNSGATGANKPTTLATVLDRVLASFGTTDWNVLVSGSPLTIQQAVSGNVYINVKNAPYSAAGDGSTDDTSAINSAILAASALGGATVFFPPGSYLTTAAINLKANVGLLGSGVNVTTIKRQTSNFTLLDLENSAGAEYFVQKIKFHDDATGANVAMFTVPAAVALRVDYCTITDPTTGTKSPVFSSSSGTLSMRFSRVVLQGNFGTLVAGGAVELNLTNTNVTWAGSTPFGLSGALAPMVVTGCTFSVETSIANAPAVLLTPAPDSVITGCRFNATTITLPDTVCAIQAHSSATTDNTLLEAGNQMDDCFTVLSSSPGIITAQSRTMRRFTGTLAAPGSLSINGEAGMMVVTTTGIAGTYTMAFAAASANRSRSGSLSLIIRNTSANNHTIDFTGTSPADVGVAVNAGLILRAVYHFTTAGATTSWFRMTAFTVTAV